MLWNFLEDVESLDSPHLRSTMGALILGAFISIFLSGIVTMQVYLYYRLYSKDALYLKLMVTAIWLLDILHTVMVSAANWTYLIAYYGDVTESDNIIWSVAVTIAITAIITFIVHCFFTNRIHASTSGTVPSDDCNSNDDRDVRPFTKPTPSLSCSPAIVCRIRTGNFPSFVARFKWMFTMGLVASAVLDISIAFFLSFYLRKGKSGYSTMDQIIDALILYTVETDGFEPSLTTIVSLICWVAMSHNLVYLALHFTISKLYANSFLATLNSRKTLKVRSQASSDKDRGHALPILFPSRRQHTRRDTDVLGTRTMEISVQRTIHREIDGRVEVLDDAPSHIEDDQSSDKRSMRDL
ncbi:hypothetical protein NM688_g6920 [Phlebia brevispora]|uniref:Uncharacterized protein n=1 Tax=Phlebia brevispora TaxID=194682 RepID=A0ACC1SB10_9APHY|nr:hypothetical protein NM688_g6920 [Phlebia brevispora]